MNWHPVRAFTNWVKTSVKQTTKILLYSGVSGAVYLYYDQNHGGLRRVRGPSMQPTFNSVILPNIDVADYQKSSSYQPPSDIVYISRNYSLSRGCVVYCLHPKRGTKLVKRVIGIEGDTIQPRGLKGAAVPPAPITLQQGEVWLESDAGQGYSDSDLFGPLPQSLVLGRVTWALDISQLFTFKGETSAFRWIGDQLSEEARARLSMASSSL